MKVYPPLQKANRPQRGSNVPLEVRSKEGRTLIDSVTLAPNNQVKICATPLSRRIGGHQFINFSRGVTNLENGPGDHPRF